MGNMNLQAMLVKVTDKKGNMGGQVILAQSLPCPKCSTRLVDNDVHLLYSKLPAISLL